MTNIVISNKIMNRRIIDYVFQLKKKCLAEEAAIGKEVGLSPSEIHCIESVIPGERLSGNILSERMGLSPSRGSRVIDHLIEKGLLRRMEDPVDRRSIAITVTEKGAGVKQRVENAKRSCEAKITAKMDSEQIDEIKQGLKVLVDTL
jgi:DNA-binding MarR family transcriptional regulator